MTNYHIAEINIGRTVDALESKVMAEFVGALAEINAVADASPGFVWRLQSEDGNATAIRVYEDPRIIVNVSVWESVAALRAYAYTGRHVNYVRRRSEWFEAMQQPYMALWWVSAGTQPTALEAKARLDHLEAHGETPFAFSFRKLFEPTAEGELLSSKA
jgi:hypothetical protein